MQKLDVFYAKIFLNESTEVMEGVTQTPEIFSRKLIVLSLPFSKQIYTIYLNYRHLKPDLTDQFRAYSCVYLKRLNCNKDNSNDDCHHGFKLFEVSGLSHQAAATSCFHHDCSYVLEPCAGIASVSKRPSEEPLKENHIAFSVVLLDSKYSIMNLKFVKQKSH